MAEIKSTLDLVMERTRNLKFSEEEKRNQQREDAQKAFNGIIQQYLDQLLDIDEFNRKVTDIREEYRLQDNDDNALLAAVILERIDPEALEGPLPGLLAQCCDVDVSGLEGLAHVFRQQMTGGREQRIEALKAELQTGAGIAGSAVLPNLEADPEWQREIRSRMAVLNEKLDAEKARLNPAPK